MKIYNVFQSSFLKKTSIDSLIGQVNKPALSIIINNNKE